MITDAQNVKIKKLKSVPSSSLLKRRRLQSVTQSSESTESGESIESGESSESGETKNYSLLFPLPSSTFPLSSFTKNTLLRNKIILYFVLSIVLL